VITLRVNNREECLTVLWGFKNVGLKSTGFPQVYRSGVDMHALTFKRLFKVSATNVL